MIKRKSFCSRFRFTKAQKNFEQQQTARVENFSREFSSKKGNFSHSAEEKCKTFRFSSTYRVREREKEKSGNKNSFWKFSLSMTLEKFSYPRLSSVTRVMLQFSGMGWGEAQSFSQVSLFVLFFSLYTMTSDKEYKKFAMWLERFLLSDLYKNDINLCLQSRIHNSSSFSPSSKILMKPTVNLHKGDKRGTP